MKRITKALALIISICILCVSFSGCISLKDMREQQAYISGDDIVYNNATYKIVKNIPADAYLYNYSTRIINLTEKDVPVLLSEPLGNDVEISSNNVIICDYVSSRIYCREDKYDELNATLNNINTISNAKYVCEILDTELSDEQVKAINDTIANGDRTKLYDFDLDDFDPDACPEINILWNFYGDLSIFKYILYEYEDHIYIYNNEDEYYYTVQKDKLQLFKPIIDKYNQLYGEYYW